MTNQYRYRYIVQMRAFLELGHSDVCVLVDGDGKEEGFVVVFT